jgi:lysyl-tRNA synthetase class II
MKLLLVLIFLVNTAFAQDAALLDKGDSAPFKGVLLTTERATEAMKAEKANLVLKDLQVAQEELTEYHRDSARKARNELTKTQVRGYMNVIGAFVLGVLVTGFAAKMNNKIQEI